MATRDKPFITQIPLDLPISPLCSSIFHDVSANPNRLSRPASAFREN